MLVGSALAAAAVVGERPPAFAGGEADASRDRFMHLGVIDRAALLAFLASL